MIYLNFQHVFYFILVFLLILLNLMACLNTGINETILHPSFFWTSPAPISVDVVRIQHPNSNKKELIPVTYDISSSLATEGTLSFEVNSHEFGSINNSSTSPLELPTSITPSLNYSEEILKEITSDHIVLEEVKPVTKLINPSHEFSSSVTFDRNLSQTIMHNFTSSDHEIWQTQAFTFNTSAMSLTPSEKMFVANNAEVYNGKQEDFVSNTSIFSADHMLHYSSVVTDMIPVEYINHTNSFGNSTLDIYQKSTLLPYELEGNSSSINVYQVLNEASQNHTLSNIKPSIIEINKQGGFGLESSFSELNQSVHKVPEKTDVLKSSVDHSNENLSMETKHVLEANETITESLLNKENLEDATLLETSASISTNGFHVKYSEKDHSGRTDLKAEILQQNFSSQNDTSFRNMKKAMVLFNRSYYSAKNKTVNATNIISETKIQMPAEMLHHINISKGSDFDASDIPCHVYIPAVKTHKYIVKFMILQNSSGQADLPKIFELHLRNVLNDTRCFSVVRISFSDNTPFVFSWTNSTINNSICALDEIHQMRKKMYNSSGVLTEFSESFLPVFKIVSVKLELLGPCIPKQIGPDIGVIAFSVACALSALPCIAVILCKLTHVSSRLRRKTAKNKLGEPRYPAIFDFELPEETSHESVDESEIPRNGEICMSDFQSAHKMFHSPGNSRQTSSDIYSTPRHT